MHPNKGLQVKDQSPVSTQNRGQDNPGMRNEDNEDRGEEGGVVERKDNQGIVNGEEVEEEDLDDS